MIGCSFVANRDYFGELGLLDSGMDVYGGENIELGIRVCVCVCHQVSSAWPPQEDQLCVCAAHRTMHLGYKWSSLADPCFGTLTPAGVALWRQHGGAALFQGGSHRPGEEAVPQQHRLPHAA